MNGMPAGVYESLAVGQQGRQCWHLHIDATVLDYDGSLLDCCTMGEDLGSRTWDSEGNVALLPYSAKVSTKPLISGNKPIHC
jgi:hypothetical protein